MRRASKKPARNRQAVVARAEELIPKIGFEPAIMQTAVEHDVKAKTVRRYLGTYNAPSAKLDQVAMADARSREVSRLQKVLETELVTQRRIAELVGTAATVFDYKEPTWVRNPPAKARGTQSSAGIPSLVISDTHCGEVVPAAQVMGRNHYDIATFRERCAYTFQTTTKLLKGYFTYNDFPGIQLWLNGDIVSGIIHEDLRVTNEVPITEQVRIAAEEIASGVRYLSKNFDYVNIDCEPGNHGRQGEKKKIKNKSQESYDTLVYLLVAQAVKDLDNVTITIHEGTQHIRQVAGRSYLVLHGDDMPSGAGIMGSKGPVERGRIYKSAQMAGLGVHFQTMVVGHFHFYDPGQFVIQNGSMIGPTEMAVQGNFMNLQPPIQALWITHPRLGIMYHTPVVCDPAYDQREWM